MLISLLEGTEPAKRLKDLLEKIKTIGDTASSVLGVSHLKSCINHTVATILPSTTKLEHVLTIQQQTLHHTNNSHNGAFYTVVAT